MIVVNYDKGFAEMLQHPAFRNRRTRTHPVDVDSSLLAPRRPHANTRLRGRRARLRWRRSPGTGGNRPASAPRSLYTSKFAGQPARVANQTARLEGVASGWAGIES